MTKIILNLKNIYNDDVMLKKYSFLSHVIRLAKRDFHFLKNTHTICVTQMSKQRTNERTNREERQRAHTSALYKERTFFYIELYILLAM